MKFVTFGRLKDTASMIPVATSRQLMEATVDYLKQMKQSGKILEAYALAGSEQTMTISELDSPGEIAQMIAGVPMGAFINFETYPLADFEEMMKYQIESAKKAEQLFPPK